jgi:hypothetical protein
MDIYFEDLKDAVEDGNKLREKLIELTKNNEEIFVKNFEKNYRHKIYCQMAKPLKFEKLYDRDKKVIIKVYKDRKDRKDLNNNNNNNNNNKNNKNSKNSKNNKNNKNNKVSKVSKVFPEELKNTFDKEIMKDYFDNEDKLREKLVQMVMLYKIFHLEKLDKNERHKVYCQMYKPLKFEKIKKGEEVIIKVYS